MSCLSYLHKPLFQIKYEGLRHYRDDEGIMRTHIVRTLEKAINGDQTSVYIENLLPKTKYTFNISAQYASNSWGPEYSILVETSSDG